MHSNINNIGHSNVHSFFYVGTPCGVHLFDHLLWFIFQSSITYLHYTISSSSYMFHDDPLWADFMNFIYTCLSDLWADSSCTRARLNRTDRFYTVTIQIWIIQLLFFIEKFSPLPGFEPGTSSVPSLYATNWAILAWIQQFILTKLLFVFFPRTLAGMHTLKMLQLLLPIYKTMLYGKRISGFLVSKKNQLQCWINQGTNTFWKLFTSPTSLLDF